MPCWPPSSSPSAWSRPPSRPPRPAPRWSSSRWPPAPGGAIATGDLDAAAAGLEVLRRGGNAVDAAVAAAATLGVTEAYSAGIGGGGFMVVYLADKRRVVTIDGRETAPAAFREDSFID
ncbi:MAG TPA: gamma-glutamyltransferase, partial [Actinomycetota bacterium]|nr:gamma-glutamyltransferase [Actinomycetota bacterium]